ncbi:dipeptide/oligopeptide/nickel ABC transporter permease/ATP-binding protein [Jiangella anatolica]|uniref:Peptide ABC transporter ATP-binding protein n=1 Tax=Jiangella anatolica TaxID=2670374 RepID=A0A2W2BQB3_9ACTN|nr:dipeptide/oligopeptide/nickel ABC transporter permease/ATP-binding protein [Jiangella anatolica]PZF82408.1 peptide ABC transporter ATP-binding protein [Jiangella anatolica]
MTTTIPHSGGAVDLDGVASPLGVSGPSRTDPRGRTLWRAVFRQPLAALSIGYLLLVVLAAITADYLAPYDPSDVDLNQILSGPTAGHWLGTDSLGRDVLSRLMFGGRLSMAHAAIAVATFLLIGVSWGLIAGFFGGWANRVFTWLIDVIIAIPALVVLLVVLSVFDGDMTIAMVALGILAAPGFARVVRGVTLGVREELYVSAARVFGIPNRHIVVKHILPRVAGPILVHASLFAGGALLIDAGLAYLGFGPQPPTPTWGGMIIEASAVVSRQPWLLVPPGVTLGLATLALALLGDAIRDAGAERTGRAPARGSRPGPSGSMRSSTASRPARAQATDALLSVRDVSISLSLDGRQVQVVAGVDLDIRAGETVGLVGESGCGKSVLGSAILGLLPAAGKVTSGSIVYDGIDLASSGPRTMQGLRGSGIALIAQDPIAGLDPVYTAGQQVDELVRRHQGGSRKAVRARSLDLLNDVRLPDPIGVAGRYPHELSGGMAQRVAIAMALAGEPSLLIADEPTTALDVTVQSEILQLLRRLQRDRGMAIMLITHDWGVVAEMCQRAHVMYAGHIVESCSASEMFDHPSHPYTLGLLGSMPRRSLPGRPLPAIPGVVPTPGSWPGGCHFAPRCDFAMPECTEAPIPMLDAGAGHGVRCIRYEDIRGSSR